MTKYIDRYYLNGEEYGIKFGGGGWQPGANTLLYYSFENDSGSTVVDDSGNSHNGTWSSIPVYSQTATGKKFVTLSNQYSSAAQFTNLKEPITISAWFKTTQTSEGVIVAQGQYSSGTGRILHMFVHSGGFNVADYGDDLSYNTSVSNDVRHNAIWVRDYTNLYHYLYIDGVFITGGSMKTPDTGTGNFILGKKGNQGGSNYIGSIGSVIVENKLWTAQEIADYFNQTKSLYGIS